MKKIRAFFLGVLLQIFICELQRKKRGERERESEKNFVHEGDRKGFVSGSLQVAKDYDCSEEMGKILRREQLFCLLISWKRVESGRVRLNPE